MNNNSTDQQRRVLGLLLSLLEDDRTKATEDWKALKPAESADIPASGDDAVALALANAQLRAALEDANGLLRAALLELMVVTADKRLGGRAEYVAGRLQSCIRMEAAGR